MTFNLESVKFYDEVDHGEDGEGDIVSDSHADLGDVEEPAEAKTTAKPILKKSEPSWAAKTCKTVLGFR